MAFAMALECCGQTSHAGAYYQDVDAARWTAMDAILYDCWGFRHVALALMSNSR